MKDDGRGTIAARWFRFTRIAGLGCLFLGAARVAGCADRQKNQQQRIGNKYAVSADEEMHLKSGEAIVLEAEDITLKAPGGFIRLDASGVTIKGVVVKVNCCGGSALDGSGSDPEEPLDAAIADPTPPERPEVDDVAEHNFGEEHPDR